MPTNGEALGGDTIALLAPEVFSGNESLPAERCLEIHRLMVRTRAMEERMIKMSKSGQGYFWIGGPGEEAFNACLGLQVKKGRGPAFDYLHLHYRNSATLVAMGMPLLDGIRQMAMTATDTHSMGRNFAGHFARRDWNVVPVTSVIEVQYVMAPGTALVQKRHGGDGITIVTGGEAGTAEGDFASCLIWSTRPGNELPVLIIVTNNGWGISTPACQPARRDAHHRPRQGVRHSRRGGGRQRPDRQLARHPPGHGLLPPRTPAVHAGGDGVAAARPFVVERRPARQGRAGRHRRCSSRSCSTPACSTARPSSRSTKRPTPRWRRRWNRCCASRSRRRRTWMKHTYAPSTVDAVYPDDYTGLP